MNQDILRKFLSNECSYRECQSIAEFLENDQQALDEIDLFENITSDEIIHVLDFEKQEALERILKRRIFTPRMKQFLVAAVALIVGLFSFYKIGLEDFRKHGSTPISFTLSNTSQDSKWYFLPDSSRVKLEPDAQLSYRADFLVDRELTQIGGQVTYYVYPDTTRPLRVIYQGVQTQALGTIFSIRNYNQDKLLIELLEGKILLEDHKKELKNKIFLNDHQAIILNKKDMSYSQVEKSINNYKKSWDIEKKKSIVKYPKSSISWSNSVVVFNGVSNPDLFNIMERLYAVTIDIENQEILNGNFTGEIYHEDNLESLLRNFCQINGCKFSIENEIVVIK